MWERYQGGWWAFGGRSKEMQGRGRAWDPSAVLFSSFPSRAVFLQDKSLTLSQIGPAGNRRMSCPALLCHDWKQHRRPRFSPGRLNAILVWGISCQLLLVIEPWKFVHSVDVVPRSFILSGRCAGAQPRALNSFGWQDSQDLNVAVLSIFATCSPL